MNILFYANKNFRISTLRLGSWRTNRHPAIYESKTYSTAPAGLANYSLQLQLASHEEGRIRAVRSTPQGAATALVWDYMLKDHLGNVRMVLTEEAKTNFYPAATMEAASIANESNFYSNLSSTQTGKPGWFTDPAYPRNASVARLRNASGFQKIGPSALSPLFEISAVRHLQWRTCFRRFCKPLNTPSKSANPSSAG